MLDNICNGKEHSHQGTLIQNGDSKFCWYQSNENVFKLKHESLIINIEKTRLAWKEPKKIVISELWEI
ncbi:MAG: hypothetical protein US50_C0001G0015 [Candidatus Nomurabacteria bacterium GW2011_GWB1_37_5]|uniref:Uncharacterized protein n=1 Tax=Candidatus Nomurabacteria bacterium GW2011_GWB1_37_5 TaxID=1618742 RepID=A0A0G0GYE9_9BACT|nr:MAG: hypothetical protein US50_C0001G0015 [Candidatus Nomurabacteria bacterium GW2011_GWB1_37_5]